MEIESCYKNILISMHGGILCHFNRNDNELIPFITTNELTSIQLLAVAPRACVNFINSKILNNIVDNCYKLFKSVVPSGITFGFLEKIMIQNREKPLDKEIKKIIKKSYDENGLKNYFVHGKRSTSEYIRLQSNDKINTAGFLTTYTWRNREKYGVTNFSLHDENKLLTGFNCGIISIKNTNYYLAPNFYQKDGLGYSYLLEKLSSLPKNNYTFLLCSESFKREIVGYEYNYTKVNFHSKKKIKIPDIYLQKIFIEEETGIVYCKQLAGYNFLSCSLFIHFINEIRKLNGNSYQVEDTYGQPKNLDLSKSEIQLCTSISIPLLKQIYSLSNEIMDVELMMNYIYNFELNKWFENDGYVSYIGLFCRNMTPLGYNTVKYHYETKNKKCYDDESCIEMTRNIKMSPRKIKSPKTPKPWFSLFTRKKRSSRKSSSSSSSNRRIHGAHG
jgi:hypothetical protein